MGTETDNLAVLSARLRALQRPGPATPVVAAAPPSPVPTPKAYLRLIDVGQELGVHPRTVRAWEKDGLRICRVGRVVIVLRADLDAFLRQHSTGDGKEGDDRQAGGGQ